MAAPRGAARVRAAVLVAGILLPLAGARAQPLIERLGVEVVSMRGTLVVDRQAAQRTGWGGISFGFTGEGAGTIRWFGVAHAEFLGGDVFRAKSAVFRTHLVPALTVAGPAELATRLRQLPDDTRVRLSGAVDRRTRVMLLDTVEPLPPQ